MEKSIADAQKLSHNPFGIFKSSRNLLNALNECESGGTISKLFSKIFNIIGSKFVNVTLSYRYRMLNKFYYSSVQILSN